jgi:hypothetical protein
MFVIVLNQTNVVPDGQNNKLIYKFPNSVVLKDKYIAVSNISMYYSWFNITSTSQNNFLTYTFTSAGVTTTYTILIPDGLYEISAINNFCQFTMIQNNTYWTDTVGDYVYPFDMIVNPNRYAIQINTYLVPDAATAAAAGYTPPAGILPANFWPTVPQNPVITIPANFNIIVGYTAGFASNANVNNTYVPPTASASTNYVAKDGAGTLSYLSNTSPQVQPNNNVLFSLSNISNPYSQPSSIIYSLNPNVAVGEQVYETPPNFMWNKMIDGTYNEIRLTFLGNNLQPLIINDPNMTILLTIRDKSENMLTNI